VEAWFASGPDTALMIGIGAVGRQAIAADFVMPSQLADRIAGWYDDFAAALANFTGDPEVRERGKRAARAFDGVVRPLLSTASPSDRGLLAHLATEGDDRLSDDEIIANALIILFGGIETTASMIGNTVWSVFSVGEWDPALADSAHRSAVIEEAMRWQPAVQSITRHTTDDVELRGVQIRAGSVVQGMIGGANRDPTHFEDPDRFDPSRHNSSDHLAFGIGRHLCLGAHLARIEIGCVLSALSRGPTLPALTRAGLPPLRGYEFRSPQTLALTWRSR
jgi:cytochrome P450